MKNQFINDIKNNKLILIKFNYISIVINYNV